MVGRCSSLVVLVSRGDRVLDDGGQVFFSGGAGEQRRRRSLTVVGDIGPTPNDVLHKDEDISFTNQTWMLLYTGSVMAVCFYLHKKEKRKNYCLLYRYSYCYIF